MAYGQPMTEEERMAQIMAGMRNPYTKGMTVDSQVAAQLENIDKSKIPGMPVTPDLPPMVETLEDKFTITPEGDYSSEEASIANQRAYANSLRGSKTPGAKMLGNVAAMNYGEGFENAFNRGLGGYMSGKADKASEGLSKTKADAAQKRAKGQGKILADAERKRLGERTEDQALATKEGREYGEWTVGEDPTPIGGYKEHGLAFQADGSPMPKNASEIVKASRSSGSQYLVKTDKDEYGNIVSRSFDKGRNLWSEPTFTDNTPYSKEEADRREGITTDTEANRAGAVERTKGNAQSNQERIDHLTESLPGTVKTMNLYGEALDALAEGARTGFFEGQQWAPTWKSASIVLDNVQEQLGLEKIGQHTFGSLSQAEGDWVKKSSIPKTLPEEELIPWIQHKAESMKRAIKAEEYELEYRQLTGNPPPRDSVKAILYGPDGEFQWGESKKWGKKDEEEE